MIRQRPVTPPRRPERVTHVLPPVRVPQPKKAARRVLQIVEDDETSGPVVYPFGEPDLSEPSPTFDHHFAGDSAPSSWRRRPIVLGAIAAVVIVTLCTGFGALVASRETALSASNAPSMVNESAPVSTTTLNAAVVAAPPAVPVFDVNSLPSAPAQHRSR